MTSVNLTFNDYPRQNGKTGPSLFSGNALVTLRDGLVLGDEKSGIWMVPLQRRLRFSIDEIGLDTATANREDLIRFITGRYGLLIESLLYAAFLREQGLPSPNAYELMAEHKMRELGQ